MSTLSFRRCLTGALLLLAGGAHASLNTMATPTGNPAMAFVALDSIGTPTSVFVDLGYLLSDFDPIGVFPRTQDPTGIPGALLAPGTTVQWDFRNDAVTVNGVPRTGDYRWASELSKFESAAQREQTGWAVIGGSANYFPNYFFTSGNPTQAQINSQQAGDTTAMQLVESLYFSQLGKGTFPAYGVVNDVVGAHAQVGGGLASTGYAGNPGNFNTAGTWQTTLRWSAFSAVGGNSGLYTMNDEFDDVGVLPGTFTYDNGVLTWQTTPIPEPAALAMGLVGLCVLGAVGRRRPGHQPVCADIHPLSAGSPA